ncbi:MAG TPA: 2-dehydropantoate 2-reductase [Thermomicrobiales bacterium]|nr:2-dehydropantoate 2-reductase [Thermomicrobiales bacterium]HRA31311.1 2-dehydropantoate 2-reductase [Thermomicrobiales bacterium]
MKVVVVGAGAMGGLIGTRLSVTGHNVVLYDTWTEHVDTINRHGIVIHELDDSILRYRIQATTQPPQLDGVDLLLIEVKSYDTLKALRPFAGLVPTDTFVLSLQNGLGNLDLARAALPNHERLLIGTTAHGSAVLGPGRLRHTGKGATVIGDPTTPPTPRFDLAPLRRALTRSGFDTEISSNIHTAVWNKLVANIAINALTAITGVRNGDLLDDPDLQPIIARLVAETVAVMQAAGVPAGMDDPLGYARKVMRDTSVASSSMLQDIRYGRQTEVDAINGAVARLGAELGVPTPVNRLLTTLVHNRERGVRREGPALKLGGASDDE